MSTQNPHAMTVPTPLHAIASRAHWKAGLDLGSRNTVTMDIRAQRGANANAVVASWSVPSVVAFQPKALRADPEAPRAEAIGEEALRRRDHLQLVSPLTCVEDRRASTLTVFAQALRSSMRARSGGFPWGVVACPLDADDRTRSDLRAVGNELFERMLLVSEQHLLALGLLEDPFREHAIVVDLGASSTRACVVGGFQGVGPGAPLPYVSHPFGGDGVDEKLNAQLVAKYPDLVLTAHTLRRLKEQLSFVLPEKRSSQLRVKLGKSHQMLDVSSLVADSFEPLVATVLHLLAQVILALPRGLRDAALQRVVLVGGGASTLGLAPRLKSELEKQGFEGTRVVVPEEPQSVVALGGARLALLTPDDEWEMPLFALRPAV